MFERGGIGQFSLWRLLESWLSNRPSLCVFLGGMSQLLRQLLMGALWGETGIDSLLKGACRISCSGLMSLRQPYFQRIWLSLWQQRSSLIRKQIKYIKYNSFLLAFASKKHRASVWQYVEEQRSNKMMLLMLIFVPCDCGQEQQRTNGNQIIQNNMSSLITSQSVQEATSLAVRLRQLQQANKQVEQALKLQLQFISIHLNVPALSKRHFNNSLTRDIQQQHSRIHQLHSQQLLNSQVHLQQESEMNELIKNYQARIVDLQRALISKQAEIAQATEEEGTDMLPRRENLRKINLEGIQKNSIQKALQEVRKLNVEIEALEYSLKSKSKKYKENTIQKGKPPAVVAEAKSAKNNNISTKEKVQNMHRDKLLVKIYQLLYDELAKEGQLKSELQSLKEDWNATSNTHKQLLKKYKRQDSQKSKTYLSPRKSRNNEINFLDELQKAEKQPVQDNALFHKVDLNVERHKVKGEKKRPLSRDRPKLSKQN